MPAAVEHCGLLMVGLADTITCGCCCQRCVIRCCAQPLCPLLPCPGSTLIASQLSPPALLLDHHSLIGVLYAAQFTPTTSQPHDQQALSGKTSSTSQINSGLLDMLEKLELLQPVWPCGFQHSQPLASYPPGHGDAGHVLIPPLLSLLLQLLL